MKRAGFSDVTNHSITLENYRSLLDGLHKEYNVQKANGRQLVLLNLVDGSEYDGYPGQSIIEYIEELGVPSTGANAAFYDVTTTKPRLKQVLIDKGVSTSAFVEVGSEETVEEDVEKAGESIGFPLIIKPSNSYASYGISDQSVVHTKEDAVRQIRKLLSDKTTFDGIFMEKFLRGREFTVLVTGDANVGLKVFPALERAFSESLPIEQRFLAFERYWNGYDLDGRAPAHDVRLFEFKKAPEEFQPALQQLARDAYLALGGTGYGRVDIRSDDLHSSRFFVLEVNAQCDVTYSPSSTVGEVSSYCSTMPC